jgi:hypothetical protein
MEVIMSYFTQKFDRYFGQLGNNDLRDININDIYEKVKALSSSGKSILEQEIIDVSLGMTEYLKLHNSNHTQQKTYQ